MLNTAEKCRKNLANMLISRNVYSCQKRETLCYCSTAVLKHKGQVEALGNSDVKLMLIINR